MTRLFKDRPDLDHLKIRLESGSEDAKDMFYRLAGGGVEILDTETYMANGSGTNFANFVTYIRRFKRGTRVEGLRILVCREDFGEVGARSIDPVIHHEISEVYHLARGQEWPRDCVFSSEAIESQSCHQKALLDEFEFAFQKGIADEHLAFILSKADDWPNSSEKREYLKENKLAYKEAKRKFLRRKRKF